MSMNSQCQIQSASLASSLSPHRLLVCTEAAARGRVQCPNTTTSWMCLLSYSTLRILTSLASYLVSLSPLLLTGQSSRLVTPETNWVMASLPGHLQAYKRSLKHCCVCSNSTNPDPLVQHPLCCTRLLVPLQLDISTCSLFHYVLKT